MSKQPSHSLPVHHKDTLPPQQILDLFKVVFKQELYESDEQQLSNEIQIVKSDLYNRDYISAFNTASKRAAYCCRWSPSRAVAYASLFATLTPVADILAGSNFAAANVKSSAVGRCHSTSFGSQPEDLTNNILCIGGGAGGELVALVSAFTLSRDFNSKFQKKIPCSNQNRLSITLVDISNWEDIIQRLNDSINTNWLHEQSKFLNVEFKNDDILKIPLADLQLPRLDLITSLFTTNELFLENRVSAVRLFQKLNTHCTSGCLLLIVESAGSYSHITIGSRRFPIQFLIDTLLLGKPGEQEKGNWELLSKDDSLWYRGDANLSYPMKLENMRVFYRLYRKK
ncbi:25S rRNA (uracil2843-N3)-methyltransferase Ecym_1512 [Eremothecium cymbalariae DBVPG|uniref:25S rRNA (Uridine(2843)-N(3))-methyltransferase n=1 Tax=Eremothecium cymbalariae (strain CBS 270.75 / DBVPG 7215 / KCTC 17166 / NRRL Y-17582) TaxID=931890 RepID=G8JMS0_ERECY|nr:hypothetical protein Ecym_1512 [Eremothecium cymbalariae DBVPG\